MILVYPSQVQEQLNIQLVGRYEGNFRAKRSSAVRSGRFSHMEDWSALVPTPDRCLCVAGLFLIVLRFLCQMMPCKPCSGIQTWVEVTPLVAFWPCISHFVFPKQARREQFPNVIPSTGLASCAAWHGFCGQGWVWLVVGREAPAPGGWAPGLVCECPPWAMARVAWRDSVGQGLSLTTALGQKPLLWHR